MRNPEKEQQFMELLRDYKDVVAKVCYLYKSEQSPFEDLYQEVLANLWEGISSFRGDAKMSTWVYRTALNTCITWYRRNKKHSADIKLDNMVSEPVSEDSGKMESYNTLYSLISHLEPYEKALISLWLEEKSYDEIAAITGITKNNVAVRLHRIKEKLSRLAPEYF